MICGMAAALLYFVFTVPASFPSDLYVLSCDGGRWFYCNCNQQVSIEYSGVIYFSRPLTSDERILLINQLYHRHVPLPGFKCDSGRLNTFENKVTWYLCDCEIKSSECRDKPGS